MLPSKFIHWLKILSKFVSVQILVQVLNLASGILVVRTLNSQEYAYFTIANTMQATMNAIADMGIGISLSAIGGKVWQDSYRFGQLINTALQLRYFLAVISITLVTPILIWMLIHNNASVSYATLITIVVLIGFNFQLTNGVLTVIPRLHSQISQLRNLDLFSAISRLVLLGISYLTFWNAGVAIASASLVTGLQRFILGRWARENIDTKASINQEDHKFIRATVKNVLPNTVYFCVQGQLNIFLISIFGSTQNVSEIGALGRLSAIFTIVGSLMSTIVLPSFSRCQSGVVLRQRYFQILSSFLLFGILVILISSIFSNQILWILGENYIHLKTELILMIFLNVVAGFTGITSSLNLAKAWVEYIWMEIPMRLTLQIILLMTLDISTIRGVILLNLISEVFSMFFNLIIAYVGLKKYKNN